MEKIVIIDGKECKFKTNAGLPVLYRRLLRRDLFEDMHNMTATFAQSVDAAAGKGKAPDKEAQMDALSLEENIAFAMHKHGDPSQPDTVYEWISQFEDEAALQNANILRVILDLWNRETETTSEEKKKKDQSTGE